MHHYQEQGEFYGYPQCCINQFIAGKQQRNFDVAKHTGFVPCDRHARMIRKGEKKLEDIIKKTRKCEVEFPYTSLEEKLWNQSIITRTWITNGSIFSLM